MILLSQDPIHYRTIPAPFADDPDFRALQTDPGDEILFRVGSRISRIAIDVLFFNGSTPVAGTCDAYVFNRAKLPAGEPLEYLIGRAVGVTGFGPITGIEKVQEGDYYGIRISNVNCLEGTSLRIYICGLKPEGEN